MAWRRAAVAARQGRWTEEECLALEGEFPMEFVDGRIEVLPFVTIAHQRILMLLLDLFRPVVDAAGVGEALFGPLPTRLRAGLGREPDLIVFGPDQITDDGKYPRGARLVAEIINPGRKSRERDCSEKRSDYAKAGIPEYWLIDPRHRTITVLRLDGPAYVEHGTFRAGDLATSVLLPGFEVDVAAVFAAGERT